MATRNAFGDLSLEDTQIEVRDLLFEVKGLLDDLKVAQPLPTGAATNTSVQALLTNEQLRAQQLDVEVIDNVQGNASIGATNRPSLQYAAVLAGGINYAVGDVITLGGGSPATVAMVEVTAVNAGVITSVKVVEIGRYTAAVATMTQASTTGAGTGATFTTTFANNIICMVDTTGFNSFEAQCITHSGGTFGVEFSLNGLVWTNASWYFTNFGAWSPASAGTGSVSASSLVVAGITAPFVRLTSTGNTAVVWSLRSQTFIPPMISQGANTGTNQFWYGKNIISPFGSAGHATSGGKTKVRSAATTNATLISSFLTTIYSVVLMNTGATPAWLKFYNKGTTPVVGTDVPVALYPIPANGGMLVIDAATSGLSMFQTTTGLGYAITGAPTDLDMTGVAFEQITGTIIFN